MMKIAIITLPLHTNYGGILQAYALQTVLKRMGHKVELLEPVPVPKRMHHPLLMPLVWIKRGIRKYIKKEDVEIFHSEKDRIREHTESFINTCIRQRFVKNWNTKLADKYDALVVGSDQIWRPMYCDCVGGSGFIGHAFGDFTEGCRIRRIAYAVSFGTSEHEYSPEQIEACGPLAQIFNAVSVREASGIQLCKDYFDIEAQQVLDPTLLLPVADYEHLIESGSPKALGDLLVYILDENEETAAFVRRVAKEKKMTPFRTNSKVEQHDAPIGEKIQPPVEQWLQGFRDASLVITDSFHACVFSILFQKPFLVIGNRKRGMVRIDSLLHLFGLEQCVCSSFNAPINPIDWNKVNAILEIQRKESLKFLQQVLR